MRSLHRQVQKPPYIELRTDDFCPYHRKHAECFSVVELGPEGLCPEMYYVVYPLCFAYVYGGFPNRTRHLVRCPKNDGVSFIVKKAPAALPVKVKNVIKEAVSCVRVLAKEVRNADIVANQVFTGCSKGKRYRFNLNGKARGVCPAAFESLFPHVFYDLKKNPPGGTNKVVSCPDHKVNLCFKVITAPTSDHYESCGCYDFSPIHLEITNPGGNRTEFPLTEIMRATHFRCLSAFQVIFPYYLTLVSGGSLGFYTSDRASAIVQCPNSERRVQFHISQDYHGEIHCRVLGCAGECPLGYRQGETHTVCTHPAIPLHVLHVIYLYAVYMLRDSATQETALVDPLVDDGIVYRLFRKGR